MELKNEVKEKLNEVKKEFIKDNSKNIYHMLRNNADVRRFVSIGITNYLIQKQEIYGSRTPYISYLNNRFIVKADNLSRTYSYKEAFFINCFAAAFASFTNYAQQVINVFVEKEINEFNKKKISNEAAQEIAEAINVYNDNIMKNEGGE